MLLKELIQKESIKIMLIIKQIETLIKLSVIILIYSKKNKNIYKKNISIQLNNSKNNIYNNSSSMNNYNNFINNESINLFAFTRGEGRGKEIFLKLSNCRFFWK